MLVWLILSFSGVVRSRLKSGHIGQPSAPLLCEGARESSRARGQYATTSKNISVLLIWSCFGSRRESSEIVLLRESSGVVRILRTLACHGRLNFVRVLGSRLEQEVNMRKPLRTYWIFEYCLVSGVVGSRRKSSHIGWP